MSALLGSPPRRPDPDDDAVSRLRRPPHSLEAEQSVLGGLMLDNTTWDHVGDLLTDTDFYRFEHRLIYAAIGQLIAVNRPADVITVFERLQAIGKADEVGGLAYVNSLAQSVPMAANMRRYGEIVRERSVLRQLVAAGDEIVTSAFNVGDATVMEVLDVAQQKLFAIGDMGARGQEKFQSMDSLVVGMLDRVQEMAEKGGEDVTGIPTGFYDLDELTCGLQGGDLVILAARPSMGKTAFSLNIAEHVAMKEQLPVVVFSMEMGASQLALRTVASVGRINAHALQRGRLNDDDWGRLTDAVEQLRSATIYVDDTPALSPIELRARAKRQARQCGKLGLVVVDYLQLMSVAGSSENRATEIGEISRGLKALAKELQCPVIALSQLNRSVETRPDKRPVMSDLRESGALEQDADVIFFIYRDDYYNKDSSEPGVAEIIIGKARNGPTGTVKLAFLKPLVRFDNLSNEYKAEMAQQKAQRRGRTHDPAPDV